MYWCRKCLHYGVGVTKSWVLQAICHTSVQDSLGFCRITPLWLHLTGEPWPPCFSRQCCLFEYFLPAFMLYFQLAQHLLDKPPTPNLLSTAQVVLHIIWFYCILLPYLHSQLQTHTHTHTHTLSQTHAHTHTLSHTQTHAVEGCTSTQQQEDTWGQGSCFYQHIHHWSGCTCLLKQQFAGSHSLLMVLYEISFYNSFKFILMNGNVKRDKPTCHSN